MVIKEKPSEMRVFDMAVGASQGQPGPLGRGAGGRSLGLASAKARAHCIQVLNS